ncbi:TonB-dependent receptor [Parabacteroides sp. OttesenSCG-928-N08]|nr:TonB-dependent receptor [Parabacteroides sp. OttesenSCG-928-N08]
MRELACRFIILFLFAVTCSAVHGQMTVKGTVVDAATNEPLIGVAVIESGTTNGVASDVDGYFELKLNASNSTLLFKFIGYEEMRVKITNTTPQNLGILRMKEDAVALADVTITSSIAVERKTPVALSNVTPLFIEERIGVKEFPEILRSTPSVTVVKEGGGFGDSKINMRGFKSENVAVMVNGVPMNDMEWGGVYWSNWLGLMDVTRVMQTQRGIGASKVSAPSVGGSINIVTRTIDAKKGGFVSYGIGENGRNKVLFSVSTGLMDNGWAVTMLGGKTWGDGYVQGTEFEGYNYFLSIAKRINDSHQISLTGFGAPQTHNQRSRMDGLSIKGWQEAQQYMQPDEQYKYNPTYGFGKNGERKTSAKNKYHKPQISLNHMWDIDNTSSLSTALYLSLGDGYGYSGQGTSSAYANSWYGASNGKLNTTFRNADGTFAYDQIQELNEQSENGSQMVMSVSKNLHKWYGILSTYTKKINENLELYGGIDGRYYIGTHTNEIIDLYNGAYYVDARNRPNVLPENNKAALDPNWKNEKLTVGDVVYRDYDGHVAQGGLFAQLEYNADQLSAFVSGSASYVSQWRYDRFYYDKEHAKSEAVNKMGYTAKGGVNYNLTDHHNVFANVGYISRAPFFSGGAFLQSTTSNEINSNAVNEKSFSFELGYGYKSQYLSFNVNAYHTTWNDKTMANPVTNRATSERATINMKGVNALHQGIEVDLITQPFHWLEINGMFSIGNWRWTNNAVGYFYSSNGQPITSNWETASGIEAEDHAHMTLNLDGVKVGGSAQTTASIGAKFKLGKGFTMGADWFLHSRLYADWDLSSSSLQMNGTKDFVSPWEIPGASVFDFNAAYSFKIGGLNAQLSGNISNVFDQEYIDMAYGDGTTNDWGSAYRVFYGFGREMSARLKVSF